MIIGKKQRKHNHGYFIHMCIINIILYLIDNFILFYYYINVYYIHFRSKLTE